MAQIVETEGGGTAKKKKKGKTTDGLFNPLINPGVPVAGRGTTVYVPREDVPSPNSGARRALEVIPQIISNPFSLIPSPVQNIPPAPPQVYVPASRPQAQTGGINSAYAENSVMRGRGYTPQPAFNPYGTAGMYTMNPQVSTDPRYSAGRGQNYNASQTLPFNPYGTAGMYSFAPDFPNFRLPDTPPSSTQSQDAFSITAADGKVSPPPPSSEIFDPTDAASAKEWRDWWNWHAEHPAESRILLTAIAAAQGKPDPFAVHVPTREEVWKMKHAARMRQYAPEDGGGGGFTPVSATPEYNFGVEQPYGYYGNQSVSASWRVGG